MVMLPLLMLLYSKFQKMQIQILYLSTYYTDLDIMIFFIPNEVLIYNTLSYLKFI